ncbi:50S ribosomal protein L14 [Candidatus Pacearchaeota archaeon]|nr:50S ribosomal protein L14 [Candidatus Pacearchaeota archaeon]
MKAVSARMTRGLNIGSHILASDNSGARIVKIVGVKHGKSRKGRYITAKVGDWIKVSVRAGNPEMKGKVFDAVLIRQKKPFLRKTGERIAFTDNAAVLLKDEKGNPKGTQVKGAIPREVQERWKEVAKLAQFIV